MIEIALAGRVGDFALDVAFHVPARGVTALFGPSGCGKTTVLRCIAGLTQLSGRCVVNGDVWQDAARFRPTHRRPIGVVFQEASLFAHLSVRRNLLYGAPRGAPIDEIVHLLGLARLLDRATTHLSGGERQRVAIGRALLSQPRLLLMDEPLAALDHVTKQEILPYLERLQTTLSLPVIYVSHDMAEVERLADHLVLMAAGQVVASGPIATLQSNPALPLAQSRGAAMSLDGIVCAHDATYGMATVAVAGGTFQVPMPTAIVGAALRLRVLAGDVSLAVVPPGPSTISNILPARIQQATPTGAHELIVVLELGDGHGARLLARVTRRSWERLALAVGQNVFAQVKGVALVAPNILREADTLHDGSDRDGRP